MTKLRNCLKNQPTTKARRLVTLLALACATTVGSAYADDKLLEKPLDHAYNLGQWIIVPVALGLLLCVIGIGRGFARRRKEESRHLVKSASAAHMRMLLLTLLGFYLFCILSGLIWESSASSSAPSVAVGNQEEAKNAGFENLFGRFRMPLREGSFTTFLCVAAIVFGVNTFGAVTSHTIPGLLLIPGVALLGYTGWQQGTGFATVGASTFGSMAGFLLMGGLEFSTYVLATAVGANVALAVLFPSWSGVNTRKESWRTSLALALKFYGVIVAILILQAICETFYVRQVLLHGGSGVPLAPY